MNKKTNRTRLITQAEQEACAREQVQYIGTIQPHGFVLVIDKIHFKIVQHSQNFLSLLNTTLQTPLPEDHVVINTPLSYWIKFDKKELIESAQAKATQINFSSEDKIISPEKWECLAVQAGNYLSLEFISNSHQADLSNMLTVIDRMINKVKESKTLSELYKTITDQFQQYTEYDRVMLYKFHPDWSGEVISESTSEHTEVKYLGLRFPAEDIPTKARELYLTSSLRIIADVDAKPVPFALEYLPNGKKLDQSHSILRGMSRFHVKYLKNMGVKSSLSIGLVFQGKLWGLIALHHHTPRVPPHHLVSAMKISCELFSDIILSYLKPAVGMDSLKKNLQQVHYIEKMFKDLRLSRSNLSSLHVHLENLRKVIKKDHIGIIFNNQLFFASKYQEGLGEAFVKNFQALLGSEKEGFFESSAVLDKKLSDKLAIAGLLAKSGDKLKDISVFFAAEEIEKEVTWGGKPHTVNISKKNGVETLEPRSSFNLWKEKVKGQSREWTENDRKLLTAFQSAIERCILYNETEEIKLQLQESTFHDDLTGLANRLYLTEYLKSLSGKNQLPIWISVLFLNLDKFKRINDYIGHHAGDQVLIETARRLQSCAHADDLIARLGGDEFVLVTKHNTDDMSINHLNSKYIAENIVDALSKPIFLNEKPLPITSPSIGILVCCPQKFSANEILRLSDIAMYHAKRSGKDSIHFFNEHDQEKIEYEGWLEQEMRHALKNKSFEAYYQPQFNSQGALVGTEVLARWEHPQKGFISPEKFIPIAEKNNLINKLGTMIFDISCKQLSHWKSLNLIDDNFSLSVNISAVQLLTQGFQEHIESLVKHHGLRPDHICLEITETIFMENFEETTIVLDKLRKSGFIISLDDFGTGYSSLSYLLKLPIDQVKIDQSFVKHMQQDQQSLTMVEGIVNLCNRINLTLIAEGVETKNQFNLLKKFGCSLFQGFHFGHPVPATKFEHDNLCSSLR